MKCYDWLRFRADLFMIASMYFLYRECYWAAGFMALMFWFRRVQAAQLVSVAAADELLGKIEERRQAEDRSIRP